MDRISTTTAVPDLFGPGKPGFRDGDKASGIPATNYNALWSNALQEELMAIIEGAGLEPSGVDFTQVRQAIQSMIVSAQKAVIIEGAVFEASVADGEAVYYDAGNGEFAQAIADGTDKQNAVGIADVTNARLYAFGDCPIMEGLAAGARYYLSDSVAGAITTVAPVTAGRVVTVLIAKSATVAYVDIDFAGGLTLAQADARYTGIGYMMVRDEKAVNVAGGSSVVGTQTRTLNTVSANTIAGASLASNKITLPAGTYRIRARAPVYNVDGNKAVLYNVTDSSVILIGSSNDGLTGQNSDSRVAGRFTLAATKELEIRHYCVTARATDGLGNASNVGALIEVYTEVEIEKES